MLLVERIVLHNQAFLLPRDGVRSSPFQEIQHSLSELCESTMFLLTMSCKALRAGESELANTGIRTGQPTCSCHDLSITIAQHAHQRGRQQRLLAERPQRAPVYLITVHVA